jgi:hypothetical protein
MAFLPKFGFSISSYISDIAHPRDIHARQRASSAFFLAITWFGSGASLFFLLWSLFGFHSSDLYNSFFG